MRSCPHNRRNCHWLHISLIAYNQWRRADEPRSAGELLMRKIAAWMLLLLGASFNSWAAAADNCPSSGDLKIICGHEAVEDLVRVGKTQWLLGSGMAEAKDSGHLRVIDTRARTVDDIYPDNRPSPAKNPQRFPECRDEPDAKKFSAHGIGLRDVAPGRHELLVVNHGREA